MQKRWIYLAVFIFIPLVAFPQTEELDKNIETQSRKLEQLRKDIDKLNQKILKNKKNEQSTLKSIQQLEKQIAMITQLKRELKKERKLKQDQIALLEETIEATTLKIQKMKERAARRAVQAYKLGRQRDLELLLASGDINQAVRRSFYLSAIHHAEQQKLTELQYLISENKINQSRLEKRLSEVNRNIREEERSSAAISEKQRQKSSQLKKLKKDRASMLQQIKSKQAAAKKLEGIIADLEKRKQERLRELARRRGMTLEQAAGEFAKNRGRLAWPVQGKLVSRFGLQKNERLGTVINNPGIDISAPKGRNVHSVMDGIVVAVTWIPTYGNTLILDHGDGYYTVYAHIDNIQVTMNSYVLKDQIVAKVSDTGSLDGPRLHFEVWKEKDKVDPLQWLKK